jgi:hypothetical protein
MCVRRLTKGGGVPASFRDVGRRRCKDRAKEIVAMTKRELLEVLAGVPASAEVYVCGAPVAVVACLKKERAVTLDHEIDPFLGDGGKGYEFLCGGDDR